MNWLRESFGAKLLAALLGTVGLLLLVTFGVVRSETARQVEIVTQEAAQNARALFEELNALQRQQAAQLARPFTEGRRALAMLEEALASGDVAFVADQIDYEMQLAGVEDALVVFTDSWGEPVLSIVGGERTLEGDPAGISPLATELLNGEDFEADAYRSLDGRLYNIRSLYVELAFRPIGTISFGLPFEGADVDRIGAVGGVEVCFRIDDECLVRTAGIDESLLPTLALLEPDGALRTNAGGSPWAIRSEPLVPADPTQGARIIAVPLEGVLAPFDRISQALLLGGGASLLLSVLLGTFLSRSLTQPVRDLVDATGRVADGEYDTEVEVGSRDELGKLATAFNDMTRGLLMRERYRSVLSKVVSQDVAEELMRGEVELGGENREITVLFADIRGFTPLTEGMEPQEVIGLLNDCMEHLARAVDAEGGVVDKFIGDEVMAVFGAPARQDDHARRAVKAALRMRDGMLEMNLRRRDRGLVPVQVGIGINTGEAVAGNMGSADRLNYTVLGAPVNMASRLCGEARAGEIVLSRATLDAAGPGIDYEIGTDRHLKGFSSAVEIFLVNGMRGVEVSKPESSAHGAPASPGLSLTAALLLSLGLPAIASAQDGWPTLRDAGIGYQSASGAVQIDLSGQADLEGYWFSNTDPGLAGLAYGTGLVLTPRLRLFTDVFLGDHVYALVEVRGDRGEEPTDTIWDARLEQAYVRLTNGSGTLGLQAGLFASPFGSYSQRHLSVFDPFVRPPLAYDHRTVISRTSVPLTENGFLNQRNSPSRWRPAGAPPVWGVPYQWGAMLTAAMGPFSARFAGMNSAPSSEPAEWYALDVVEELSWVAGLQARVLPELLLGVSYNHGPYMETSVNPVAGDPDYGWPHYNQTMISVDANFARGPVVARAEFIHDKWVIPNLADEAIELAYSAEVQWDVLAGVSLAGRWGRIDFLPLGGTGVEDWDWDVDRFEAALGYRITLNAGVVLSYGLTKDTAPLDAEDDLMSFRLWWAF